MRWLRFVWVTGAALTAVAVSGACSSPPISQWGGTGGSGSGGAPAASSSSSSSGPGTVTVAASSGSGGAPASSCSSGPASVGATGGSGPCWDGCNKIELQCMLPSSCAQLNIDCTSMDPVYNCMGQCALNAQCVEILQQNSPFAMCVQGCILGGAGGAGGGTSTPAQQCINCTQQSCQADITACGMVCGAWFNCVAACPDQACVQNCNAQTPQAQPVYSCGCANCGSTCGPFCSGMGGAGGAGGAGGGP